MASPDCSFHCLPGIPRSLHRVSPEVPGGPRSLPGGCMRLPDSPRFSPEVARNRCRNCCKMMLERENHTIFCHLACISSILGHASLFRTSMRNVGASLMFCCLTRKISKSHRYISLMPNSNQVQPATPCKLVLASAQGLFSQAFVFCTHVAMISGMHVYVGTNHHLSAQETTCAVV